MRKTGGGVVRALGALSLVATLGGLAEPALARPTRTQRCAAAKAGIAGGSLGGSLACHAKARAKSTAVSTTCLDKATSRFGTGFDDANCPGDGNVVHALVDACVTSLTGDVTGNGKCPGASLRGLAAGARALGGCAARDALHPGKGVACQAKAVARLDGALAKASACTDASARNDLVQECWAAILAVLAGQSTTTTSTTTSSATTQTSTSLPIPPSTTSTTSTSTPPTTGATFPTSTTTTDTTVDDTTTTTTTTTTTSVPDTTTSAPDTTTTTMLVECGTPANCPGQDTECLTRTCLGGACGVTFTAADTVVTDQVPGNCHDTVCDGGGGFTEGVNDADLPDDGNPCTDDVCTHGVPSHSPTSAGTPCNMLAPLVCDGAGTCVQCLAPDDCPGVDTECSTRTCVTNQCGVEFVAQGTPVVSQVAGDCHVNQCNGAGDVENVVDDGDFDDGNECTTDMCNAGVSTHTPLPDTTPCSGGECNLGFCCAIGQVCG